MPLRKAQLLLVFIGIFTIYTIHYRLKTLHGKQKKNHPLEQQLSSGDLFNQQGLFDKDLIISAMSVLKLRKLLNREEYKMKNLKSKFRHNVQQKFYGNSVIRRDKGNINSIRQEPLVNSIKLKVQSKNNLLSKDIDIYADSSKDTKTTRESVQDSYRKEQFQSKKRKVPLPLMISQLYTTVIPDTTVDSERIEHRGKCKTGEYFGDVLKPILQSWDDLAQANKISYFLTAGSLFGAYLHGDLIDCDSDLDVLINRKDMSKLEAIQNKRDFNDKDEDNVFRLILQYDWRIANETNRRRFSCNDTLYQKKVDECSFVDPMGRYLYNNRYIDIYSYTEQGERIANLIFDRFIHHKYIFPLKRCDMIGVNTYCPKDTESFLKVHYDKKKFDYLIQRSEEIKEDTAFAKNYRLSKLKFNGNYTVKNTEPTYH